VAEAVDYMKAAEAVRVVIARPLLGKALAVEQVLKAKFH
jgi:hypothetical protein